jgi:MFS family permease
MPDSHDPYGALRFPDYRRLLGGSILASIASNVQSVAVGWELYERTNSAAALGMVGLVQFLPILLLSLPAGQVADRYSRKGQFLIAQAGTALASLGLLALSASQGPVQLIYLCLLLGGISQAFATPARWSLVPQVVPAPLLSNAVTWNSSGFQVASVAGPALAGLILWALGNGVPDSPGSSGTTPVSPATGVSPAVWVYGLAAVCSLACVGLILFIRPQSEVQRGAAISLRSLLAGIEFVWSSKLMLAAITLDLFAVLLGGATALLPIFAKDILQVGPAGLGWLRAAPAVGAFLMALVLAHRPPMRRPGVSLLWAVVGFGLATIVFGLATNLVQLTAVVLGTSPELVEQGLFGLSASFILSFLMLALTGALDNISVVVRGTLVQVLTPDSMRGRVSAVNGIFISSSNQLGDFESGVTAWLFGPVISVVGGGIGTILVVLVVMLAWPQIIGLGPLHAVQVPESPEAPDITRKEDVTSTETS